MLAEEHAAGEHDAVVNASCIDCTRTPTYVAELRRHHDAMRRTEDYQAARRALIKQLVGDGSPTGRLSTKKPVMQSVKSRPSGQIDHSQCDHEKTAKARSACRRARRTV